MTLDQDLRARIRADGPLPLDAFMAEAVAAYYARGTAFGRAGDFTTAPEVCQVFGEILGLWAVVVWQSMGQPAPLRLVELGPGRGTLMRDALRAARAVSPFLAAADVHLVERSPALRQAQKEAIAAEDPDRPVTWHDALSEVPDGPAIILGNEFLDALPIRQMEHTPDGWHWRAVDLDETTGTFTFVAGAPASATEIAALGPAFADAPVGSIAELSPAVQAAGADIAGRVATQGGAALLIDYGYAESIAGDSLQAVKAHQTVSPLTEPGGVDLTAHVDFARLAEAARAAGAAVHGPVGQGRFLSALGAEQRGRALIQAARPEQAMLIDSGVRRLIHPSEMGTLFKGIAFTHPQLPLPPGFEGRSRP